MGVLVPDSFLKRYQENQKQLIADLSRTIIVGLESELVADCPNCAGDSMTNLSASIYTPFVGTVTVFSGTLYERNITTKSFKNICSVCKGKGILTAPNEVEVPSHVQWGPTTNGEIIQVPAGAAGQHRVRLKTDSKYYNLFFRAKYFIVDGIKVLPEVPARNRGMGTVDGIVEIIAATEDFNKETGHI